MSETKKMTDEEKIQEIDRQIARVIDLQEKRIADYNCQIAEDYRNFFHWHAGDMYKAQMIRECFENVKEMVIGATIEEIIKRLDRTIRLIEDELIGRTCFGSCTDEIVNLEHRLKLDGKREIREKLKGLYMVATFND